MPITKLVYSGIDLCYVTLILITYYLFSIFKINQIAYCQLIIILLHEHCRDNFIALQILVLYLMMLNNIYIFIFETFYFNFLIPKIQCSASFHNQNRIYHYLVYNKLPYENIFMSVLSIERRAMTFNLQKTKSYRPQVNIKELKIARKKTK